MLINLLCIFDGLLRKSACGCHVLARAALCKQKTVYHTCHVRAPRVISLNPHIDLRRANDEQSNAYQRRNRNQHRKRLLSKQARVRRDTRGSAFLSAGTVTVCITGE